MRCLMKIDKFKIYIVNTFLIGFVFGFYIMPAANKRFACECGNSSHLVTNRTESSTPAAVPRTNIFFLRTHKTASTTVVNILMRYGHRHSLNFMLPAVGSYLGYLNPIREKDMDVKSVPPDGKFNILAHHTRYRLDINRFLYADTVRVTSLRDPSELFESIFHYFHLDSHYEMSLRQLIHALSAAQDVDPNLPGNTRVHGRNQMSRDLGLETPHKRSETEISDFIQFVDGQFHLVMIREHLEASLVLLADLMNWPLDFVSFVSLNVRQNISKTSLDETDRVLLSRYNLADHLLYEYFLEKFRQRVVDYGFERMSTAIQQLLLINSKLRQRCVKMENYKGHKNTNSYVLRDPLDWECVYSTQRPVDFTDRLRERQIERLKPLKKLQNLIKSGSDYERNERGES